MVIDFTLETISNSIAFLTRGRHNAFCETKTFTIYCLILYQKILNLMANELLNVKAINLFRSLKTASDYVSVFQLKCNRKFCAISQSIWKIWCLVLFSTKSFNEWKTHFIFYILRLFSSITFYFYCKYQYLATSM